MSFDLGALSLDFADTAPGSTPDARERFRAPGDLGAWLAARVARLDSATTERELADALLLRHAIRSVAQSLIAQRDPGADDIDTVNLFAATPDVPPALPGGRRQAGAGRIRVGQAISSVARDAVALFAREQREREHRIRACAADDCARIFVDDSRTNSRRWCSMQRCGNRAKVRAHRARTLRPE